jgi:3-phosphoshikimate 1-carboxyvinyltransferase
MREINPIFLPTRPIRVMPALLEGDVHLPPSKSVAHRALICAALTGRPDWRAAVRGLDEERLSEDIRATERILHQLTDLQTDGAPTTSDVPVFDCGESGSTLRFLIPAAAALGIAACFTGSGRLPQRPLREYADIFARQPVRLSFPEDGGHLPLRISGRMQGGRFEVPGDVSSQYLTGLLLALPLTGADCEVVLTSKLQSAAYVALTVAVMQSFGVTVEYDATAGLFGTYYLAGGQRYRLPEGGYAVEADYSQAAFWLVAAFIGARLRLYGLNPDSAQGDRAVLEILRQLSDIRTLQNGNLRVDGGDIPDLIPILAVAAATVPGTHRFENCGRLRLKESDRFKATAEMIRALGAACSEEDFGETLVVYGIGNYDILEGNTAARPTASTYNDHRIAMSLAIAGCSSRHGVVIDNPSCVAKSYPDFFEQLVRLGGVYIEEKS